MKKDDILQPFLFEHGNIRGCIVNLTETYQTIINQHPYPAAVKKFLGEAMISCLFLSASMKFEGTLSLQFQGDQRLSLLAVQCDDKLQLRATAKYEDQLSTEDYDASFLSGQLSLTLNMAHQPNVYRSIVPINSCSMSENMMHYLSQSEQITSQVWLATSETQAAGMMLQLMPEKNVSQQEQFWEYALAIGQTLDAQELFTLDNQTILHRLYHETDIRLFDERPIRFKCSCSLEKMQNVLLMLGVEEAKQILRERGQIDINCDFCTRHYQFDAIDTEALFHPKSIGQGKPFDSTVKITKEINLSSTKKK